jgi:hypothetical protein
MAIRSLVLARPLVQAVTPRLDPGVHRQKTLLAKKVDRRIKPAMTARVAARVG